MIEITNFGKKAYLSVMDDEATMKDILVKIVADQKQMLSVDNRKVTTDELFKTSSIRLRSFRKFLCSENLKKQVDFALQS